MSEKNIILIGFMGAGKTSLGKAVSKLLSVPFLDTDEMIVQSEGMSVNEIFATKGEEYFRSLETETIRGLAGREGGFVLSVGGGLPLRAENRPLLRSAGCVVYLKVSIETLEKRLANDTKRPLLQQGEGTLEEKIRRILTEREPLYLEAADVVIVNDNKSFSSTAHEIAALGLSGIDNGEDPAAGIGSQPGEESPESGGDYPESADETEGKHGCD